MTALVAFLICVTRTDPGLLTEPFIANVAGFWDLTTCQAEAAVLDLLLMHGESAGDSIIEDLSTLEVIFSV